MRKSTKWLLGGVLAAGPLFLIGSAVLGASAFGTGPLAGEAIHYTPQDLEAAADQMRRAWGITCQDVTEGHNNLSALKTCSDGFLHFFVAVYEPGALTAAEVEKYFEPRMAISGVHQGQSIPGRLPPNAFYAIRPLHDDRLRANMDNDPRLLYRDYFEMDEEGRRDYLNTRSKNLNNWIRRSMSEARAKPDAWRKFREVVGGAK